MKHANFYRVFVDFIKDMYDAENQIVKALPDMIQSVHNEDLKKCLSLHLEETRDQITRIKRIFQLLGETSEPKECKGMKGVIEEGREILRKPGISSTVKDCFIIISAQKVEHYEIASYGSALTLAKHMKSTCPDVNAFKEVCELLEETLKEEKNADKKLTTIAEGKLFMQGVNHELEKEIKVKR